MTGEPMFPYTPLEAKDIIVAASELSMAASALKELESSGLNAAALSDAWDAAYTRLYQANEALKALLGAQDENV